MHREVLLTIDGIINLLLGIFLLLFPGNIVSALGIPMVDHAFYPSILGGVLIGIAIALFIERFRSPSRVIGLGLGGAVSINLCAGLVLVFWLISGKVLLPPRGALVLWILVFALIIISFLELRNQLVHEVREPSS